MVTSTSPFSSRSVGRLLDACSSLEVEVREIGSDCSQPPARLFDLDDPPPAFCSCPGGSGKINLNNVLQGVIGQAARHRVLGEVIRFDDDCVVRTATRADGSQGDSDRSFHIRVKGSLKRFGCS
ncbi:MAG: hypothetical protein AAGC44_03985 [Planctomycetota bacterium]